MPELPEVETIRQSLEPLLLGKKLCKLELFRDDIVRFHREGAIEGLVASTIRRRGKYLMLDLQGDNADASRTLVFHLRMTGKLLYDLPATDNRKHTHVRFWWQGNTDTEAVKLDFNDVRRFGRIDVISWQNEASLDSLAKLGPDPISETLTHADLISGLAKHPKTTIKQTLLDQGVLAGLGNIYADEVLFRTKIHPQTVTSKLTPKQVKALYKAIKPLLEEAIGHRGTSFRDYVDGFGNKGFFQLQLAVYGRKGKPCPVCQTPIERIVVGGRSTHFCPKCQRG